MMGHQSRQMAMLFVDIESLIPETHLLRKIERMVSFDFIYDLLAPYYPATGRPSVDPVSMFKMLLVGYLYGIKSERRLVEEVQLNIAYRWFCGFELDDTIPNHSTFSKTRTRKWQQSSLFQKAFYEIVKQCIDSGLIDGEAMAADGSYIPANVSRESWINVETEVEQSMQSYLDSLDEELSNQPGFKKPPTKIVRKCRTTSQTDPDSGYINHGSKRGIGYLMEATVDCKHGILTGVDVYSANEKESVLILRHLERQINLGIPMSRLALDRGYETGAVHRGLELLGIIGYIPAIQFSNPPEKYGFSYDPQLDAFICPEGAPLTYHRLNCSKSTGKYLRCYQVEGDACMRCPKRPGCFDKAGIRRRVLASSCYPAFFRGHQRVGTPEYLSMMRLRKIWAEGSFSVLKREHCISKIRKRGILAATEECLLAAMALNLKRMAKCHLSLSPNLLFCWNHCGFQQFFCFCQQVLILSQYGYDLSWSDFENYDYIETGSGLYIRVYVINEMYELWIGGGSPDSDPMYIYLALADDLDTRIDIRDGGVTEFIGADHSEVLLAKAINEAILAENKPSKPDGLYHCASFVLLDQQELSGTPAVGSSDHIKLVTVYGLALHQGFGYSGGTFHDAAGSHIAVAITFEVVDGKYVLKEYWTPRDGSYYVQDIRDKFPDEIEDEALDTQKYILAQKQECYDQAVRYGGVDTYSAVEHLFEVIESSPATSSRPADYIDAHPIEYRELTYYGSYTLQYVFSQFLEGGQTGLRGHLMRSVLDDLAPEAQLRLYAETGQEYFDEWKAGAIRISEQHDMEWIKENQPAIWLLLQMIDE